MSDFVMWIELVLMVLWAVFLVAGFCFFDSQVCRFVSVAAEDDTSPIGYPLPAPVNGIMADLLYAPPFSG